MKHIGIVWNVEDFLFLCKMKIRKMYLIILFDFYLIIVILC